MYVKCLFRSLDKSKATKKRKKRMPFFDVPPPFLSFLPERSLPLIFIYFNVHAIDSSVIALRRLLFHVRLFLGLPFHSFLFQFQCQQMKKKMKVQRLGSHTFYCFGLDFGWRKKCDQKKTSKISAKVPHSSWSSSMSMMKISLYLFLPCFVKFFCYQKMKNELLRSSPRKKRRKNFEPADASLLFLLF